MNRKLKAKIIEEFGSQVDFAQAIQVSEGLISRVVNGRQSLSPEDLKKWSRVLGCEPEVFKEKR
jgi:plasmid maintenance system antidote protein VapI